MELFLISFITELCIPVKYVNITEMYITPIMASSNKKSNVVITTIANMLHMFIFRHIYLKNNFLFENESKSANLEEALLIQPVPALIQPGSFAFVL